MTETQRSLGGVGQREAGAYPHTLVIWDYINEHPGVTRDELKAKALELDWIDRGYAHRFYLRERTRQLISPSRKHSTRGRNSSWLSMTVADVARDHSDAAVRAVVAQTLAQMCRDRTVRRHEMDGYYAIRRPRATAQVQARVRPRDEVVAGITLAEARRKLLAFGIDRLEESHARVPLEVRQLLAKWLRASQLVEQPGDT